ncbi:MAG: hypothetical protein WCI89_00470 [bacterium]
MADGTISWQVATHTHYERSPDWYWTLGVVAVVGAGISIYFSNMLFALILLIGASSVGMLVARGPREHLVSLGARGVSMDGTLYPYESVQSFWVEQHVETPRLFLTTSNFLHPHIIIPLDSVAHGEEVRGHLAQYAEETERLPRFSEEVAEIFGL